MADDRLAGTFPDWKLERYLLGELPEKEMESFRQELERSELLRARVEALRVSGGEILELYPPGPTAKHIRDVVDRGTTPGTRKPSLRRIGWAFLPAAALLLFAVYPDRGQEMGGRADDFASDTRVKAGSPTLQIFRKTTQGVEELRNGAAARPHDIIQVKYRAGGHRHGAILSVDGRSSVTVHLPEAGSMSAELIPGRADTLGYAYELDDAPNWERFYFVTSDTPFNLEPLIQAARRQSAEAGPLAIAGQLTQNVFELRKVVPDGE